MKKMRIVIDKSKCSGAGMCVMRAPEMFDQCAEDGKVFVKPNASVAENIKALREAVFDCPTRALSLVEQGEPVSIPVGDNRV